MKHNHEEQAVIQAEQDQRQINEDLVAAKRTFLELERHAKAANERIRHILKGLAVEEMAERIKQLRLSDKALNFLSKGIVLEDEDEDICMVVEEIRRNRAANPDQSDHLNYLDL